jgi:hypothetical protein
VAGRDFFSVPLDDPLRRALKLSGCLGVDLREQRRLVGEDDCHRVSQRHFIKF